MLIKESTLRRIIREEARRALREEVYTEAGRESAVSNITNFANAFASQPNVNSTNMKKFNDALASLKKYGSGSKVAKFAVAPPPSVSNYRGPSDTQPIGQLLCLMASMANEQAYVDYGSAQGIMTTKSSPNVDVAGPMISAALGGITPYNRPVAQLLSDFKLVGSTPPPGGVPAQAAQRSGSVSTNLKAVANGTEILKRGSKNVEAVKDLQTLINAIMPGAVVVDGIYGDKTVSAIVGYQKAHGIQVDGQCGRETLNSMFGQKASISGKSSAGGAYLEPAAIIGNNPTQRLPESRRRRY